MRKINLFVVGAAKCGTTSLYEYLVTNGVVNELKDKEPHFFGEHSVFGEKKVTTIHDYHENVISEERRFNGDFSTSYLYSETAAEEIYSYNPDAKIVIVLRHPFARAVSLYNHQRRSMREDVFSFYDAVSQEPARIKEGYPYGFHYMRSGLYYSQVKRYIGLFGRSNVLVIRFDELVGGTFVGSLNSFLDVSIDVSNVIPKENKTGIPKSLLLQGFIENNFPLKGFVKGFLGKGLVKKIRNINTGHKQDAEFLPVYQEYFKKDLHQLYELLGWEDEWL